MNASLLYTALPVKPVHARPAPRVARLRITASGSPPSAAAVAVASKASLLAPTKEASKEQAASRELARAIEQLDAAWGLPLGLPARSLRVADIRRQIGQLKERSARSAQAREIVRSVMLLHGLGLSQAEAQACCTSRTGAPSPPAARVAASIRWLMAKLGGDSERVKAVLQQAPQLASHTVPLLDSKWGRLCSLLEVDEAGARDFLAAHPGALSLGGILSTVEALEIKLGSRRSALDALRQRPELAAACC